MNEPRPETASPYTVDRLLRRAMFPSGRAQLRRRVQLNRPTKPRRSVVKAKNRRRNRLARQSRKANR